ncbi:Abi family protein [Photobacterium sp. TY1-4]|uniref:Abi family protein n=1 Tax=Photobacterium sp. TY1-4 TaxID=2899122 RepID=UPI0021BF6991|nr:Abi family protein [Photobacterium sp. TY1-4]UXI04668.1 Abi family protein [Photobacterium sp. TY1-4]
MQAADYQQLQHDISLPRLSSYQHFFQPDEPKALYGYYCWNEAISSAFFRLIGIVEITLRNKIHRALSQHYHNGQSNGSELSNDWYNFLDLNAHSEKKILAVTHRFKKGKWHPKQPALSHDDVISRMTYGFWPKVFDIRQDKQNNAVPWGKIIPNVIPHHRQKSEGYWKKIKHQDILYARLELIGSLRNRIAHFEPIWKQGDLFEETRERQNKKPKLIIPAPSNAAEAMERLILLHSRAQELLGWLSQTQLKSYQHSYIYRQLNWLLSQDGMDIYIRQHSQKQLSPTVFKRQFTSIIKQENTVSIVKNGKVSGVFYPSTS